MVHSAREKLGKLVIISHRSYTSVDKHIFSPFLMKLFCNILWLHDKIPFFQTCFTNTSLQHPLRTSRCFQTLNSYLKEFLEDPQSFPVDRVIQGGLNIYPSKYFTLQVPPSDWLHLHLDLLPPSSSHSFRSLNFSNIFQDHWSIWFFNIWKWHLYDGNSTCELQQDMCCVI